MRTVNNESRPPRWSAPRPGLPTPPGTAAARRAQPPPVVRRGWRDQRVEDPSAVVEHRGTGNPGTRARGRCSEATISRVAAEAIDLEGDVLIGTFQQQYPVAPRRPPTGRLAEQLRQIEPRVMRVQPVRSAGNADLFRGFRPQFITCSTMVDGKAKVRLPERTNNARVTASVSGRKIRKRVRPTCDCLDATTEGSPPRS